MLHLFVTLWNTLPDGIRIAHIQAGWDILRLLGGAACTYFEDASISC